LGVLEEKMSKKIVIIGSGFGGLSVAIRLLAHGYDVTIFEKQNKPGGKAYVFEKKRIQV